MSLEEQSTHMAPYKKYLLGAFVLFLLVVSFAIGTQYQKNLATQPNNTTLNTKAQAKNMKNKKVTWKKYIDNVHGFSIEYPSNWYINSKSRSTQLEIRKKGSNVTHVAFLFPNNPDTTHIYPKSTVSQNFQIGNEAATFDEYFTGLGQPTLAHANVKSLKIGKSINDIIISLDKNHTGNNTATIKKILASLIVLN